MPCECVNDKVFNNKIQCNAGVFDMLTDTLALGVVGAVRWRTPHMDAFPSRYWGFFFFFF